MWPKSPPKQFSGFPYYWSRSPTPKLDAFAMSLASQTNSSIWVCYGHMYNSGFLYNSHTNLTIFFYFWTSLSLNLFYFNTNCQKNKILWNPTAVSCGWDNQCYRPVALIFGECLTAWWEFHFDLWLLHLGGPRRPWKVWTDSCYIYKAKSLFWILGFHFWGKYNLGITASQILGSSLCVCACTSHIWYDLFKGGFSHPKPSLSGIVHPRNSFKKDTLENALPLVA